MPLIKLYHWCPKPYLTIGMSSKELLKCKTNEDVKKIGIEWGIHQSKELKKAGAPCIHYYTMSNSDCVKAIAEEIF